MRFSTKLALRVAVVGVAAAAIGLPAVAASAATQSITIPATSVYLNNGTAVPVTGTGFTAGETVYLVECSGAPSASTCDTAPTTATVNASGGFTKDFVVHTGKVGSGTCAAQSTTCLIEASNGATEGAAVPIHFGAQLALSRVKNVPAGATLTVVGAGFKPKTGAYVLVCHTLDPTKAQTGGCNLGGLQNPTTNAAGGFTVKIKTGPASGFPACKAGVCYVLATTDTTGKDPSQSQFQAFTIAKAAPPVKTATVAKASKKKVSTGQKFAIGGVVKAGGKGVAGLKVHIEVKAKGKWKSLGVVTTKKGGIFLKALKGLKKTAHYEAVTPKQKAGATSYLGSHSKVITVK